MKVKELIELLRTYDKEMEVLFREDHGYDYESDRTYLHLTEEFIGVYIYTILEMEL